MIGSVAALLAARLAGGSLLAAALIRFRHRLPEAFSRFVAAGSAAALLLAAVLGRNRPEAGLWGALFLLTLGIFLGMREAARDETAPPAADSALPPAVPPPLPPARRILRPVGSAFRRRPRLPAAALAVVGLVAALASPLFPLFLAPEPGGPALPLLAALSGTLLLGATAATLTLGHWYLVDTTLSIRPLAAGSALFLGAAGFRCLVALAALLTGGAAALRLASPADLVYSTTALFFSFRAITGLAAPLALAFLVRSTTRIRSTQSATGLLYVALILVLFGELTAIFLEIVSGGALA